MVSKERRAKRQHQVHVSEVIASVNNSSSIEIRQTNHGRTARRLPADAGRPTGRPQTTHWQTVGEPFADLQTFYKTMRTSLVEHRRIMGRPRAGHWRILDGP